MQTITAAQMSDLVAVALASGRFFGVTFVKRTDGSSRRMVCRGGVKSARKGGQRAYKASERGLVTVWENQMSGRLYGSRNESGYRTFDPATISRLSFGGVEYRLEAVQMAA